MLSEHAIWQAFFPNIFWCSLYSKVEYTFQFCVVSRYGLAAFHPLMGQMIRH